MTAGEEGLVGDHDVDGDRDRGGGGLSGDAFDEGVGHDLAAGAGVAGGAGLVGDAGEGGPHGDALGRGQQAGEAGHGVGCGSHRDVALGFGFGAAVDDGGGVEADDGFLGLGGEVSVAPSVERVGPVGVRCADLGVHEGPVLAGQAGRLAADEGGAPFGEDAGVHGGEGVGLFGQCVREPQEPGPFGGGLAAGVGDESGDVAALLGGGDTGFGVAGADQLVELDGELGLCAAAWALVSSRARIWSRSARSAATSAVVGRSVAVCAGMSHCIERVFESQGLVSEFSPAGWWG